MESTSVCNSNYFIVSAIAQQCKDCTAIDKENTFKIQTEKQRDRPLRLVSLFVSYGRYSSVIRYRLMPKALLRSTISAGILGRYFLLKLVSPK